MSIWVALKARAEQHLAFKKWQFWSDGAVNVNVTLAAVPFEITLAGRLPGFLVMGKGFLRDLRTGGYF